MFCFTVNKSAYESQFWSAVETSSVDPDPAAEPEVEEEEPLLHPDDVGALDQDLLDNTWQIIGG